MLTVISTIGFIICLFLSVLFLNLSDDTDSTIVHSLFAALFFFFVCASAALGIAAFSSGLNILMGLQTKGVG